MEITLSVAKKVLKTVDAGLVKGVGRPEPGGMCVEAAVCYALGLPHGDDPKCVSRAVRSLKITLNDADWSSTEARAKGMRRLALVQLGSAGFIDEETFAKKVAELSIRFCVPAALRAAAALQKDMHHKGALLDAALRCENEGSEAASRAASRGSCGISAVRWAREAVGATPNFASMSACKAAICASRLVICAAATIGAGLATSDKHLSEFAEGVVKILVEMKAPGVEWLYLTEI